MVESLHAPPAPNGPRPMLPRPDIAVPPANILIVDDEGLNRDLLVTMLDPEPFRLRCASTGEEALAMLADDPPDLILLDVMMPGMSGYEVATRIKSNPETKHIPIIMVTALDNREARLLGLKAGVEDFLSKPLDRAELSLRVRNLLRLKAYGDYYERQAEALLAQAALKEKFEQALQAQLRFKEEFLSHVSHELRTPLTAIKQFTSILLGGMAGELTREQNDYQRIVLKNIHQLQSMIDDLLEVTRIDTGKMIVKLQRASVADAVADTLETLQESARAKQIALTNEVPADLPAVDTDPMRLRQILIILLDNAIKFTGDGGAVSVQARLAPDVAFVQVEVHDNGQGISKDAADRLFERLYQAAEPPPTGRKGLGLGLYICKVLVTRLEGRISARPAPVAGSIFCFTLPVFPRAGGDAVGDDARELVAHAAESQDPSFNAPGALT